MNDNAENNFKKKKTPLPWQLFIVILIQFAEPITATVIYPFINQFVRETGITGGDERKTGYFAGIIESAFFLAESLTVVHWGIASDRFGRRPVLLMGPLGLSVVMLAFGMSSKFAYLLLFRCLQGSFNGNIGTNNLSLTANPQMTDETNIADAFAQTPLMWSLGVTLGPIMGGFLSQPAIRWPDSLGKLIYLRQHPYFLPCLASATGALLIFLIAFIGLPETLPSAVLRNELKRKNRALRQRTTSGSSTPSSTTSLLSNGEGTLYGSSTHTPERSESLSDIEENSEPLKHNAGDQKPPSMRSLLARREVMFALINHAFLCFSDMCIQVLIPLMWSTSIELGGLGFSPYNIGITMGIFGIFNAFVQATLLGRIVNRFGPRRVHIFCFSAYLISLTNFPVASYLARRAGYVDWKVWSVVSLQLAMVSLSYGAYTSVQLIVTSSAPSKNALGALNGLAQAIGSCMRAFSPTFASSLYAISLQRHLAGGNAVYYILMAIIICGIRFTFLSPKTLRLPT
ncbi:hypothetical protein AMATHDRAFT_149852 [Amanita thiersii Skay4041]|uniref:Major facilitator superfamily (MFS) profile domain-containing protein n=1 Tax=Amanita thiersii Skay4041 TaxID=703135 RepID=A0A2A9NLC9_9AGAR|nr:hypothetical protein AMATHDRAFT_149852 [Amanita thiersii Skay4041]